jgi:hypothetical protein
MGGGKGGSQNTTTTSTQNQSTNIPDWLTNASSQAVGYAQQLAGAQYQPYTGQIVANQSPDTQQAYSEIEGLQGSANPAFQASANAYGGLLGQAAPQTAAGINQLSNQLYGNYQQNVLNPAQGLLGGYLQGGPATAGQVGANAQALMSPYAASVIAPALQAGQQQLALANQGIAQQANNVGAFGGSRQGVQEGVAAAQTSLGTQQQIANMLNSGWGQALTPAYGLAQQAGQQGYNAATGLAGMAQSGYGAAQTAGQNLANTNLQAGLTAAQMLPQQAVQQAQLGQQQAGALQAAGTAQEQYQQQLLNAQMGQFYGAQQQPYTNLDTLLAAVGGVPYSTTSDSTGYNNVAARTNPGLLNTITGVLGSVAKIAGAAAMF